VITHKPHAQVIDMLRGSCTVIANETLESWPKEKLMEHAARADALLVFMPDSVDDAFLAKCPRLKVIAAALKGYDNFDVKACTRRGVWLSIVPDLLTGPTSELAMALILGLTRNVAAGDQLVRSGKFRAWRPALYGAGMRSRVIGIVGMGKLGRSLAQLLTGFGTRTIYADPVALPDAEEERLGVTRVEFGELLARSNVVVMMVPLAQSSIHLIGATAIATMQRGAFLVNVGRGSVVDEKAVADALDSGQLAGYAADVFEMEDWARPDRPQEIDPRLLRHVDRTLFTPHLGSAVGDVRLQIEMAAASNILQALRGERPAGAVNDLPKA
jgi:phosphonate dehydrogenase